MSLTIYIPSREAILKHGANEAPALGVKSFSIDVERLTASYEIWLDVNDAKSIVAASDNAVTSAISMIPTDMEEPAVFEIDGLPISCIIKHYTYHSLKHAYLVKIDFMLNRDKVKTYIFEKDSSENREQTRFDILDL